MSLKQIIHVVGAADVGRLDALVARLLQWPRSRVRGLIGHSCASLNGVVCGDAGTMLNIGDNLSLRYDPERKYREVPAARPTHGYTVVYTDSHLAVVQKDAGLLTVPTERRESNTLVSLLANHLAKGQKRGAKVHVVHRLDRETSGLLVFGRTQAVADMIIKQFAARKPEREYAAIVAGIIAQDEGTIQSYLRTDRALNQKSVNQKSGGRGQVEDKGELAITHYTVQQRYQDATLVAVRLETGRRNQIRVHLAEQGHPVLGDQRYQPEQAAHSRWPYKRLALHARVLGFVHPVTGEKLRFEAALPAEFDKFSRGAGRG